MSVKNNGQRVLILVIVGVFFLTSLTASGFILWDAFNNNDNKNANNADIQKQLEELQKQNNQENSNEEGKLEGTKLSNFTPVQKVEKLEVIDLKPGTGAEAMTSSTVTAHYTGALAKDGTIFQSSKDAGEPFTSPLSGLIPGWQQGIPGMKEGGTRRLIIPASLAYGDKAAGNIPANSDLVFDIELQKVQ